MTGQSKIGSLISKVTKVTKRATPEVPEQNLAGFKPKDAIRRDRYYNPLLTVPPRSPRTPEDFRFPGRLGHWQSLGCDWTNPVRDKYMYHETLAVCVFGFMWSFWIWYYGPDFKLKDWARREAYLRTVKREALGLPLIDKNIVDPERVVLPTEEELKEYPYAITF